MFVIYGWLLGLGILGIMTEVILKNLPGVETSLKRRNIKLNGGLVERKSRRNSGLDIISEVIILIPPQKN